MKLPVLLENGKNEFTFSIDITLEKENVFKNL